MAVVHMPYLYLQSSNVVAQKCLTTAGKEEEEALLSEVSLTHF